MLRTSLRIIGIATIDLEIKFLSSNAQDFIEERRGSANACARANS